MLYKHTERRTYELAAIVESSDDAILSNDLDGAITSWNAGARRLFGYTADEAIGRPASFLLPSEHADVQPPMLEKIRWGEGVAHFETVRLRKDGSRVHVSLAASPVRGDNDVVVGMVFDHSGRHGTQAGDRGEGGRQGRKPGQERVFGQHEPRDTHADEWRIRHARPGPGHGLGAWSAALPGAGSDVRGSASARDQRHPGFFEDRSRPVGPGAGRVQPARERRRVDQGVRPASPPQGVGAGPARATRHAGRRGRRRHASGSGADQSRRQRDRVHGPRRGGRHRRAGPDGSAAIACGRRSHQRTVCLHFEVTDTETGIPAEKQELIFGAFSQADSSMARRFGGTGLGLTISARLVELMGGRIWVESEVGKGSTFHFTACVDLPGELAVAKRGAERFDLEGMPVLAADDNDTNRGILAEMLANWRMKPTAVASGRDALAELRRAATAGDPFPLVLLDAVQTALGLDSEAQLAPSRADRPSPGGRPTLRILVVEDNEFNQELAMKLLQKRGHSALLAADGKAALAAWEQERFDRILMDVQLPEMDGLAVTEAIRAREKAAGGNTRVPIVALTAQAMNRDRERCLAADMDAYASKPIRAAELFAVIDQLLPSGAMAPTAPTAQMDPKVVFDVDTALGMADGSRELLAQMGQVFTDQSTEWLQELQDSALRGDAAAVERAAHKLKAAVGSLGARRSYEAAVRMEQLGQAGDVAGFQSAYAELTETVGQLRKALADVVATDTRMVRPRQP